MDSRGRKLSVGANRIGRLVESSDWARARLTRCLQMAFPIQPVPQAFDDLAFAIDNVEITRLLRELEDIENERLDRLGRILSRHHCNDN
ncbi:hypothetical protein [Novosphingobium olei]|uniref:Uncharacterized protein n=1 Tax=Novosphingobium olei TaxID=2728851 RepID=A0A7Y0G8K1_9SPHN|nr:hypothetical protein [Novosphingobium olei]NML93156.1 hypothetical protein [Novosphingobium olei]BEU99716.1 hypothetical protein NSDW_08110 [Novosphingobium olei]